MALWYSNHYILQRDHSNLGYFWPVNTWHFQTKSSFNTHRQSIIVSTNKTNSKCTCFYSCLFDNWWHFGEQEIHKNVILAEFHTLNSQFLPVNLLSCSSHSLLCIIWNWIVSFWNYLHILVLRIFVILKGLVSIAI